MSLSPSFCAALGMEFGGWEMAHWPDSRVRLVAHLAIHWAIPRDADDVEGQEVRLYLVHNLVATSLFLTA